MKEQEYMPSRMQGACLPRESKPGQICPMFRSKIQVIDRRDWADLAGKVSLQPHVKQVLDQGQVGSCAAESSVQALMIARAVAGQPDIQLNPYFVYHHTSGGRDRGSSIDSNLRFLRDKGCAPLSIWPRSKGWQQGPDEQVYRQAKKFKILEFYDIETVDEMVSALLLGFPVVYGARGHAVCKVAHIDNLKGLDVNSWGTKWGEDGFGVWSPYSGIGWNYGAFAVRTTTQELSLFNEA